MNSISFTFHILETGHQVTGTVFVVVVSSIYRERKVYLRNYHL